MRQASGLDRHAFLWFQHVPGDEVPRPDAGPAHFHCDRKPGRAHELAHHLQRGHAAREVTRPCRDAYARIVERKKERQPDDVVVVAVGEEQVELVHTRRHQFLACRAGAGTGIEQQRVGSAAHFNAYGVAAVALILRA